MKQTATKPARKSRSTPVRRFVPTAKLPIAPVVQRLPETDRELLEKILSEPIECVYDPSFRSATIPGENNHTQAADDSANAAQGAPRTDVLSSAMERTLFLRFNYCRNRVLRILRKYRGKRLTAAATRELLHFEHLALETRADIVRANILLVLAMARRSRNSGVELSELISEGNFALLRCVDKFDAARGFKFSTYACRAILASFSRAGMKAARHRACFRAPYDPAMERSDYLENKREQVEYDCVDELRRILFENSADLSSVERRVLDARFLLDRKDPPNGARRRTLDQVGVLLGVSKERVRQIQNQAMIKLRAVLEDRFLAAS